MFPETVKMTVTSAWILFICMSFICVDGKEKNGSFTDDSTNIENNINIKDLLAESDALGSSHSHINITELLATTNVGNDHDTRWEGLISWNKTDDKSQDDSEYGTEKKVKSKNSKTQIVNGKGSENKNYDANVDHEAGEEIDAYNEILQAERIRKVLIKYISPIFAAKPIGFGMLGGNYEEKLSMIGISDKCKADTITVYRDFIAKKMYAAKMFDATSNIPAGILDGKWFWPGDYELCKSAASERSNLTGQRIVAQYCLVQIRFTDKIAQEIKQSQGMVYGNCQPDSCDEKDVQRLVQLSFFSIGGAALWTKCERPKEYTNAAIGGLSVCGLILFLMISGTACDMVLACKRSQKNSSKDKHEQKQISLENIKKCNQNKISAFKLVLPTQNIVDPQKEPDDPSLLKCGRLTSVILCFSVIHNWTKLMSTGRRERPMSALGGLRVLSITWVLLGHMYDFSQIYMDNILEAHQIRERFDFQIVGNATFSVDTFFLMSGLLVAYLCLKQLKADKGRTNWLMFYVHRFFRLTPAFAFVLLFTATLRYLLFRGPRGFPEFQDRENLPCQNNWWAVLFYFGNFYYWLDRGNKNPTCMGWDWYLDIDMQLYLFSPILIFLLYKKRNIGLTLSGFLIVVCIAIRAALADQYGLHDIRGFPTRNREDVYPRDQLLYDKPYARMATYISGMLVGYIFYSTNFKIKIPKVLVVTGWFVAVVTALSVVFGMYEYTHTHTTMGRFTGMAYISLSRLGWSIAVAWVVFACATGYGGPVNTFLSWRTWNVLGRLSYCMYLVHPLVITTYLANQNYIHFTDFSFIYLYASLVTISFTCALLLSLSVEAPMISLEKIIFKTRSDTRNDFTLPVKPDSP